MAMLYAQSAANQPQTLSLTPSASALTGLFHGHVLRPVSARVHWSAAVGSVRHTLTLNSGLGSDYDVVLHDDYFTGTDWVWAVDRREKIILLPTFGDGATASDAFDLDVAEGGDGLVSYAAILFQVV